MKGNEREREREVCCYNYGGMKKERRGGSLELSVEELRGSRSRRIYQSAADEQLTVFLGSTIFC